MHLFPYKQDKPLCIIYYHFSNGYNIELENRKTFIGSLCSPVYLRIVADPAFSNPGLINYILFAFIILKNNTSMNRAKGINTITLITFAITIVSFT